MIRWWYLLSVLAVALMAPRRDAVGQTGAILLQIKPRAGDTIQVRLDQTVEMAGVPRDGEAALPVESGTLVMHATLSVEATDAAGATVVSVTDSVRVNSPPNSASAAVLAWALGAANRAVRFRIGMDGAASVPNTSSTGVPMGPMGVQLPATLPRQPIAPGTSWNSTLRVPLASSADPKGTAMLSATFTFDSLSRNGELAFVSLRGRLIKADPDVGVREGTRVETSGTVQGQVLIDRRRGWITDARTTFSLLSLVSPADRSKPAMRVRMTISQWIRAM